MPRRHWNDGQELVYQDLNSITTALERTIFDRLLYQLVQRVENAFFGDSFQVEYASTTSVTVRTGLGFQSDSSQESPEPNKRLLYNATQVTKNTAAPHASLDRIDIVVCQAAIVDEITANRKFKDAIASTITTEEMVVQKDWQATINVVQGTEGITPAVPATPTGYIKLAELAITAVSGMSGAGAVTDKRTKLPVGGDIILSTLGYNRITAGATKTIDEILASIDGFLKNGYFEYWEADNLASGSTPSNPAAGKYRLFFQEGVFYSLDSSGSKTPIGSGAGGGGGAVWHTPAGSAPIESEEYNERVFLFETGEDQKAVMLLKVPQGFITGRQIRMFISQYSPSSSDTQLLQAQVSLIRENLDPVSTPIANRTSTNSALTNTVADQYRHVSIDLTDVDGKIGAYSVDAGDILKIELSRGTDTDSEDIRFIPSATEFKFS